MFVFERPTLDLLIGALRRRGYTVLGPTVRDGAVVHDEIESTEELPSGWIDVQEPGRYRLERAAPPDDRALFGCVVGPQSWKPELFPPQTTLVRLRRSGRGFAPEPVADQPPLRALLGARPCDLHAIAIQDRTFLRPGYEDPTYRARRERLFVVAVNCSRAGRTCFCTSMGTGPSVDARGNAAAGQVDVEPSFDLALTELCDGDRHLFVGETGSERGVEVLADVPHRDATGAEIEAAAAATDRAAASMGRTLDTRGVREVLMGNLEHPRWDQVAERCLSCTNCTLVCPTCFCSTVEDHTDLAGEVAERRRLWDSCFDLDHSYLHGGSVRGTIRARYRQWLTHKLATWLDQYGTSGCVGCGRCITWCPVGIDITEEVAAIRAPREESP
jgi:sulfhydrogenase subunit beta (sulfur reductase)